MNDPNDLLEVTSARYKYNQGYPQLRLGFADGRSAILTSYSTKSTMRERGFVYLGGEFEDLPTLSVGGSTLRGFTNNPTVLRLFDDYVAATRAGTFRPGQIL